MSYILLWNVYILISTFHAKIFISTTMLKKLQGEDITYASVS